MLAKGSTAWSMGVSGVCHSRLELLACFPGSRDAPLGDKGLASSVFSGATVTLC